MQCRRQCTLPIQHRRSCIPRPRWPECGLSFFARPPLCPFPSRSWLSPSRQIHASSSRLSMRLPSCLHVATKTVASSGGPVERLAGVEAAKLAKAEQSRTRACVQGPDVSFDASETGCTLLLPLRASVFALGLTMHLSPSDPSRRNGTRDGQPSCSFPFGSLSPLALRHVCLS